MTTQNGGPDPVAFLYLRALQDLENIRDLDRVDRLSDPCFPDERGPKAKECWAIFDSFIETYRWALNRFDESLKLDREIRQQPQVAELIFRTRAKQGRQPYIEDAKAYLEKSRKLYRYLLEGLVPVTGKRTIKAYLGKVDDCRELWFKYGFNFDEIQAIPALIENLRNELARIYVDRKPTFTEFQQNEPKENGKLKSGGRSGAKVKVWTELENAIYELRQEGKSPLEIKKALSSKYPELTVQQAKSKVDAIEKRLKRKAKRDKNGLK